MELAEQRIVATNSTNNSSWLLPNNSNSTISRNSESIYQQQVSPEWPVLGSTCSPSTTLTTVPSLFHVSAAIKNQKQQWAAFQTENYLSYYHQRLRERHMIVDVSWSLGEDYEQDYEELSASITRMQIVKAGSSGSETSFKGVHAYFNPDFVSNIQCPDSEGNLATILSNGLKNVPKIEFADKGNEDTFQCHFVSKNTKFVVGIEYPDEADWFIGGGDDIEDGLIEVDCHVPHHQVNEEKPPIVKMDSIRIKKESIFSNRIASERPHIFIDEFRQDSLVTKSLLHMTSYDLTAASADLKLEAMDGFDIDENDPISFDDLGKIYKSISRQRILSNVNVQCPNVHFHAHPDGSTTIHKHKSCPTPSLATLDPRRKTSNDSSKVRMTPPIPGPKACANPITGPVNRGGKDNSYEIVSELTSNDVEEEVYSSLNDDPPSLKRSPQSMLGPLPVPPKALHSGGFKHHQSSGCECSSKEPVCDIEGGIKFNPCYLSKHDMVQGNDLCDVMLDAVWQAGHAAAVHAGKSKCMHCAHFTNKFNSEMKDIMQQNGNGNRSTSSGKGTTRSHNKHPRRDDFDTIERGGAPYGFYNPPNPMHASGPYLPRFPAVMPSKSRVSGQRSSPVDRSIKLMAYISVVVLAILLLIIVVILLIVFFQHHEF